MRKTILRRLDALEAANRAREEKVLSSLRRARVYVWMIVLGHYLGNLRLDEESPHEAHARALKYKSKHDFTDAIMKKDVSAFRERYHDAYRRLFAKAGLDFYATPRVVLFEAFVTMVNQLPDHWLKWLRCNLRQWCDDLEIPAVYNLPRQLSANNFIWP
jgi:hypothetical protein